MIARVPAAVLPTAALPWAHWEPLPRWFRHTLSVVGAASLPLQDLQYTAMSPTHRHPFPDGAAIRMRPSSHRSCTLPTRCKPDHSRPRPSMSRSLTGTEPLEPR